LDARSDARGDQKRAGQQETAIAHRLPSIGDRGEYTSQQGT
jgi:hypothetical protein